MSLLNNKYLFVHINKSGGAVITNNIYGFKRIENFSHVKNQVLDSKIVIVSPKIQLNRYFSNENPINKRSIPEIIHYQVFSKL